jgi:hypothetical protein
VVFTGLEVPVLIVCGRQHSSVSTVTGLWAGRSGFRIPAEETDLFTTPNQQSTQNCSLYIYHTEYNYMFRSASDHNQGIKQSNTT